MEAISIKEDVKEELLRYASELQMRLGRKVDYNEAIRHLLIRRRKHPARARLIFRAFEGCGLNT